MGEKEDSRSSRSGVPIAGARSAGKPLSGTLVAETALTRGAGGDPRQTEPPGNVPQTVPRGDPPQTARREDPPQTVPRRTWASRDREGVYRELEHPADLLLAINGPDLATLFENALFAFYDQVADLSGFEAVEEVLIRAADASPPDALRALLNEALYRFETKGFVAVDARVTIKTVPSSDGAGLEGGDFRPEPRDARPGISGADPGAGSIRAVARLWGETVDRERHTLAAEIKAVTYHRLAVDCPPEGPCRATVLFDV